MREETGGAVSDEPAFEVRSGESVWRIYADGRIEGFPEGSIVYNRIPLLMHMEHANGCARGKLEAERKP